jgi:PAS domain S-box-containing protein
MARGNANQAGHGQATGQARSPAAAYASYLDAARVPGDRQALALLSSVLTAPRGCAIVATDTEGVILAWSESARSLLGHGPQTVLGRMNWGDLAPGSGRPDGLPEPLAAALRDGAWTGLQEFARADGKRLTCQLAVSLLRDDEGQPAGLLTLAREATYDLRRLANLQTAAEQSASLFAGNPVPVIGTDPLGVITHVNDAAQALLGRTRRDLDGTRVTGYFTSPEQSRSAISRTLRNGVLRDTELEIRRPDGSDVAVSLSAAVYPSPDGRLAGLVVSLADLTEPNRGRAQLQRSEAYQREMIEAAGDGLVAVDAAGLVTDVNGPASALLGFRRDELTGSALADCFAEPPGVARAIEQAFAGAPLHDHEFPLATVAGAPARQVSLSASVFRSPGTQEPRVILSLHDVTEQATLRDRLTRERGYNRSIIESSANGLAMIDLQDRISDVNETLCRLTARSRGDLIGADFADFFTDPGTAATAVHQALATGRTTRCELHLENGQQPQVAVSASPVRTSAGEVLGILTSTMDISEQVGLQQALAAEQAYNRALIDASQSALFVITPEGRITDVNSVASRMTGHPRGRLLGRTFTTLFEQQAPAREAMTGAFAERRISDCELVLASPGPDRTIVSASGGVFTDPRDHSEILLAVLRDITKQKQTEERLRYYTEGLFEGIVDAFVATDVLGVIVDVNPPMEALAGHPEKEMAGKLLEQYFTEPERAREFMSAVLRDKKVTDYELTARRPDGSTTVVSFSAATYTDSDGKVQGILASARDITDRKRFEQLQASLLDRARELDQAKTDFVSRISHELRSPLTSVLGYLELLGGGEPGPLTREQRRMLEVINRNGRRLLALIEDLLLLSRIEAGAVTITWEPVQLDQLIRSVQESFAPAISHGQLTARLDLEPGLGMDGDSRQLERVVANLIANAVKFTPPGGTITVAGRRDGDDVVIEVSDTGIGIPGDEQPRLFARFFRATMATQQETQGTGLGLFIVKHVAEAHGGTVTVASAPGSGSTFTVRLPAHAPSRPHPSGRPVQP